MRTKTGDAMTQHTPGPWTFDGKYVISRQADHFHGLGPRVCKIGKHRPGSGDGRPRSPEREANARLIAANPAMLEALRETAEALWNFCEAAENDVDFNDEGEGFKAYSKARAVLAKIEEPL